MPVTGLNTLFHYLHSSSRKFCEVDTIIVILLQIRGLWLSRRWINLLKVIQLDVAGQGMKSRKVRPPCSRSYLRHPLLSLSLYFSLPLKFLFFLKWSAWWYSQHSVLMRLSVVILTITEFSLLKKKCPNLAITCISWCLCALLQGMF